MMPLEPVLGGGRRRATYEAANTNRERLLDAIRAQPGLSFNGVGRATGLGAGLAKHHLATLRGHGLVVAYQHGHSMRFFPADWTPLAAAVQVVRLEPMLRRILDALGKERLAQKELIARLAGVPRSSVQHALARLLRVGAVRVQRQGRHLFYEVA